MLEERRQLIFAGCEENAQRIGAYLVEEQAGLTLTWVDSLDEVRRLLAARDCPVMISELQPADFTALELLTVVQSQNTPVYLVLLVERGDENMALQCMQAGVEHCLLNDRRQLSQLPVLVANLLARGESELQRRNIERSMHNANERYHDIFDSTSNLIQCLAADGSFLYTNRAWRETMGYSKEEVSALNLIDVLHEDSLPCCQDRFERLKRGEELSAITFKFRSKSGEVIHVKGDCGSLIKEGEAISTRGIFENITGRVHAEEALRESEARFEALYEHAPDILAIVDTGGAIVSINRTGAHMLGYTPDELTGQSSAVVIHPDDLERVMDNLREKIETAEPDPGIEYRKIRKDGSSFWVHQRISCESASDDGQVLLVCRDVTERRTLENELAWQAAHDALTGLINRREFETRLRRLLARPHSQSDGHALCYLDLDQFKVVNDTCGHVAGDALLRRVANLLQRRVRSRDTLARLGGDEFAILMEHCPLARAEELANTIRDDIDSLMFSWESRRFSIGVSIGIVQVASEQSFEELMRLADSACYAAKGEGRNRVHVTRAGYSDLVEQVGEMRWVSVIAGALQNDELLLYAQEIRPCHDDGSGRSVEILLRMKDGGQVVRPAVFMPAAERYSLSTKLDRWVLSNLIDWFERNPRQSQALSYCSVNLSALSLCDPEFKSFALGKLTGLAMVCEKLCFEITETAAISNVSRALEFIDALKSIGCRFALDDFGSGLASFSYLKQIPVDMIKIDGSFVRDIVDSPLDQAMVRSICEIAAMMGKQTTAECVEDGDALDVLARLGVDHVQGYYLGHPRPLADMFSYLADDDRDKASAEHS